VLLPGVAKKYELTIFAFRDTFIGCARFPMPGEIDRLESNRSASNAEVLGGEIVFTFVS
jgi:hypothetical protein